MFIGHFGVGLAAKKFAPDASLGWLIGAPLLLDLIWPIFLLLGWETVEINPDASAVTPFDFVNYPISHSLLTAAAWAALGGALYWTINRYQRGVIAIAVGVVSHWALDVVVHVPDLPLYPGGPKFGFALWNSVPGTLIAEASIFATGICIYGRSTRPTSKTGHWGWWAFVGFLILVFSANLLGPPPTRVEEVAFVTLALWLMPIWAWSFDRHRVAVLHETD